MASPVFVDVGELPDLGERNMHATRRERLRLNLRIVSGRTETMEHERVQDGVCKGYSCVENRNGRRHTNHRMARLEDAVAIGRERGEVIRRFGPRS